ncbi:hypothetical protein F4777DRAFT_551437 [Nemania sp. FL0916]|nr:hypothetical protein F4777DRAFT_551437 [Nemania sp. FL0916]
MFYHQTIGNACGLYAALHAVSNGDAREFVEPQTPLADLITQCLPLSLPQRSAVLESSAALERAHASVASRGATPVPEDITVHPDFAYMTFTKTRRGGRLVQLEGCRKRPVDLDCVLGEREDMLSERALQAVKSFMEKEGKGVEVGYSAMAMCVGEEVGV